MWTSFVYVISLFCLMSERPIAHNLNSTAVPTCCAQDRRCVLCVTETPKIPLLFVKWFMLECLSEGILRIDCLGRDEIRTCNHSTLRHNLKRSYFLLTWYHLLSESRFKFSPSLLMSGMFLDLLWSVWCFSIFVHSMFSSAFHLIHAHTFEYYMVWFNQYIYFLKLGSICFIWL